MDETYTYPCFDYQTPTYYKPPGYSGTLFYEGMLQRFRDKIEPHTTRAEALEPCWHWTGNSTRHIGHKHYGMISVRLMSLALHTPIELNNIRSRAGKRLRFDWKNRCGNDLCVRPDHHVIMRQVLHVAWNHKPPKRNPKKSREEWLSYPEYEHIRAQLHLGSSRPDDWLVKYAERIALPFLTVGDVWTQLRENTENQYKEYTL